MTCSALRSLEDGKSVALTVANPSISGVVNNTSDSLSFKVCSSKSQQPAGGYC